MSRGVSSRIRGNNGHRIATIRTVTALAGRVIQGAGNTSTLRVKAQAGWQPLHLVGDRRTVTEIAVKLQINNVGICVLSLRNQRLRRDVVDGFVVVTGSTIAVVDRHSGLYHHIGLTNRYWHFNYDAIKQILLGNHALQQHVVVTVGHHQLVTCTHLVIQRHQCRDGAIAADLSCIVDTVFPGPLQLHINSGAARGQPLTMFVPTSMLTPVIDITGIRRIAHIQRTQSLLNTCYGERRKPI